MSAAQLPTTVPTHLRHVDWLRVAVWLCLLIATVATWAAVASIALDAAR